MRPQAGRKIAGVCAGVAEYFDLDVTLVRVVWLIVACFGGGGFVAYLIAWIVMPNQPDRIYYAPPASQPVEHRPQG
jgi:phage shock protein PspC (stress-responsive transcriptional regulator)